MTHLPTVAEAMHELVAAAQADVRKAAAEGLLLGLAVGVVLGLWFGAWARTL